MFKVGDEVISPSGVDLGRGTIVKIFRKEGRAWVKYERSMYGRDIWGTMFADLQIREKEYRQKELFI